MSCIEFIGAKHKDGYGALSRSTYGTGYAHRYEWIKNHGPIPKGMKVLHTCDNPPCINIEHLFLGTQSDNIADMVSKNRHTHKLTQEEVDQIRDLYEFDGVIQQKIADEFNISIAQVCRIINNKRRKG